MTAFTNPTNDELIYSFATKDGDTLTTKSGAKWVWQGNQWCAVTFAPSSPIQNVTATSSAQGIASIPGVLEKIGGAAPNLAVLFIDSTVLAPATGVATTSAGWKTTDYMPVGSLTPYTASLCRYLCWYNSTKTKIGTSIDQSSAPYTGSSPASAAFARLSVSQASADVTFKGPDPAQSILTVEGEQITTLKTQIKAWFLTSTFSPIGTITRNAGGKITTPQIIKWPDGAVGTLNITYNGDWTVSTASATYTGAGGYAATITQPTITYDGSGNATVIPELVLS